MIWAPLLFVLSTAFAISVVSAVAAVISGRRRRQRAVGFFHPYTLDGGGGERVLWCAMKAIQDENPEFDCMIYSGDDTSPESLAARALDRFGVRLLHLPKVVRLYKRKWVDEKYYPRFTMIGQSVGSIYLAWEALNKFTPQFYFDTSGYAFTYPLARLFGCKVFCYTHYPTISSDMVSRVRQHTSMYNNNTHVAKSIWLSRCKVVYYILFSWLYGLAGSCTHLVMVNSSWTRSHIEMIWKIPGRIKMVYPPCDTSALQVLPLERSAEPPILISVAQFRPEKAHGLQLESFALALVRLGTDMIKPKLLFVGSCRNEEDHERLQKLKNRVSELKMDKNVEFHKDVKYSELVQLLGSAIVGLHSMTDEHFGISVVEYMAAGAVPIAHNSAGPRMDIILEEEEDGQPSGFLASTKEEFADHILKLLRMKESERLEIASAARKRAQRFTDGVFFESFKSAVRPIFVSSTPAPIPSNLDR